MTNIRIILAGLAASICLPALAEFTTVAEAYEVKLNEFRAPASANGVATFKACTDCPVRSVRVTPQTRYAFNRRNVTLQEFRDRISAVTERGDEFVVVLHHLESDTVTSISITM